MAHEESLENWNGAELICHRTLCHLNKKRIYWHTVKELLDLKAVKDIGGGTGVHHYVMSTIGRGLLRRPELEEEVIEALKVGGSWAVQDDKVVRL